MKNTRIFWMRFTATICQLADELFPSGNPEKSKIDISFARLEEYLKSSRKKDYDFEYDQIVSYGEIWSTIIVAAFLEEAGLNAEWIDIRGESDNR